MLQDRKKLKIQQINGIHRNKLNRYFLSEKHKTEIKIVMYGFKI